MLYIQKQKRRMSNGQFNINSNTPIDDDALDEEERMTEL
jgi:hypothetical protein